MLISATVSVRARNSIRFPPLVPTYRASPSDKSTLAELHRARDPHLYANHRRCCALFLPAQQIPFRRAHQSHHSREPPALITSLRSQRPMVLHSFRPADTLPSAIPSPVRAIPTKTPTIFPARSLGFAADQMKFGGGYQYDQISSARYCDNGFFVFAGFPFTDSSCQSRIRPTGILSAGQRRFLSRFARPFRQLVCTKHLQT